MSATTSFVDRPAGFPAGVAQTRAMPALPPPRAKKGGKRGRRRWNPILPILLLFLALAGGLAYAFTQGITAPKVPVPNLVGFGSIQDAQAKIGNDFTVVEGKRVESKEAVGTILAQDPEAGGTARQGSTISVDVSGTQVADLPNVEGKSREEAQQTLESAGFKVKVETQESSADEENYVIKQDPKGDATAESGSTVTITVGKGPAPVKVPNLYNLTLDGAQQALKDAGLSLGSQTKAPSDKVPADQIVDQQPTSGTEVGSGTTVSVTVSSGPKQTKVPDVVGQDVETAKQTVWNAGFGYTVETVQSDQPAGTVVATDPAAGTSLDPSSKNVTIKASAGPPQPVSAPEPVSTPPQAASPPPQQPAASPPPQQPAASPPPQQPAASPPPQQPAASAPPQPADTPQPTNNRGVGGNRGKNDGGGGG